MVGVNARSSQGSEAEIIGKARNPFKYWPKDPTSHMSVPYVVATLVAMFVIGAIYYIKNIKQDGNKK